MKAFLRATIVGGVLFLLPVALALMPLGHALRLAAKVAQPISDNLQLEYLDGFTGIGIVSATDRVWRS